MLRLTIELVPGGNESLKKTIGVAHIINRGIPVPGDDSKRNYSVVEMTNTGFIQWHSVATRYPNVFRFLEDLFTTKREEQE